MNSRQSGSSLIKVMLILSTMGILMTVAGRVVPGAYEYYLLRDLADRVVGEYAALELNAVNSRVQCEMHRSHIDVDDKSFLVTRTGRGYRVAIDYRISMEFEIRGYPLVLEDYEMLILTYEAES
jgi:hypothetical protein